MANQGAKNVVERLAYEHDLLAVGLRQPQSVDGIFVQPRLQKIDEICFTKQTETIAGNAAQQHIEQASGAFSPQKVSDRTKQRHQSHTGATPPAFGKALRVPGKESDLTKSAELQKRAFDTPIHGRACRIARLKASLC